MHTKHANPKFPGNKYKKSGFKNYGDTGKQKLRKIHKKEDELQAAEDCIAKLEKVTPDDCTSFEILPLSVPTQKGLKNAHFEIPTKVQRESLVHSLKGHDVVVAAKTGSGKTLAFIIPLLELLYTKRWSSLDGLGAIVITPTRELAYQIFDVLNLVGKYHSFSAGLIIGGKDIKFEWSRISLCNIMICTPGRLLQHMTENPDFNGSNVQMVILDEADQCLSMGFSDQMNLILEELPQERQTLLFSATQTREVKDLIRAGCKEPIICSAHEHSKSTTPKMLKESYVVCGDHEKITFLWSFLKAHNKYKLLIFLSTCKQVKYMYDIFCKLHPGLSVMSLHGDMHQLRRMAIFDEFREKRNAVLFATDVAARGLDIPKVNYVVQLDCPEDVTTYIHRVGRTARHTEEGEGILVLTPKQETAMVAALKIRNIHIEKISVDPNRLQDVHRKIESILSKYVNLKEEAVRAFKCYLKCVSVMKNKQIFDVDSIDIDTYARSLGLAVTPRVTFVKGRKRKNNTKLNNNNNQEENETLTTFDFGADSSGDESEGEFLTRSKANLIVEDRLSGEVKKESKKLQPKDVKIVTKYAKVKKLLKKGNKLNQTVLFDEEGEAIIEKGRPSLSNFSRDVGENENSGIDILKLRDAIRDEDKQDKLLYSEKIREKHRKEKEKRKEKQREKEEGMKEEEDEGEESESEDELTQQIIDDLPDPDKCYGKKDGESEDSEQYHSTVENNDSDSEDHFETPSKIVNSKKRNRADTDEKSSKKSKSEKAKKSASKSSISENKVSKLDVEDKEHLALLLLRGV